MIFAIIVTFVTTIILTSFLIKYAHRINLVDYPNERSSHFKPTPRGGGIAIIFSFILGSWLLNSDLIHSHYLLFISIFFVSCVGLFDDIISTKPLAKFGLIALASILIYFCNFKIESLGTVYGVNLSLGYLSLPFTIFAIVGFTNSINLVDGLDGLATKISIVILISFGIIGYQNNDQFILSVSIISITALAGFLLFNWSPAKIFQGDSGALSVGFIISVVAIRSLAYITPASVLLLCFVPILDTLIVMLRRLINGQSPLRPDKTHLHHLIVRRKRGNIHKSVWIMVSIQLIYTIIGLNIIHDSPLYSIAIFGLSVFVFFEMFTLRTHRKSI